MTFPGTMRLAVAFVASFALFGCSEEPPVPAIDEDEFVISPDFHFDATRPAKLSISRDEGSQPLAAQRFSVRNDDGRVVMEGVLKPGETFRSGFPLSRHHAGFSVELGGQEKRALVSEDGVATVTFQ